MPDEAYSFWEDWKRASPRERVKAVLTLPLLGGLLYGVSWLQTQHTRVYFEYPDGFQSFVGNEDNAGIVKAFEKEAQKQCGIWAEPGRFKIVVSGDDNQLRYICPNNEEFTYSL